MNIPLGVAAILSTLTCAVHVLYGGVRIHAPLLKSDAPRVVRAVGSVIWHAMTAMMLVNAAGLLYAASESSGAGPVAALIAAQYLASAGLFVVYGITRYGSVLILPHWVVFLTMALLALWGAGMVPFSA
jgi:hypothetical protein